MRRPARWRVVRAQRAAILVGVSFAIGALVDQALTRRLRVPVPREPSVDIAAAPVTTPATPAAVATSGSRGDDDEVETLRDRHLEMPVEGVRRDALRDTFSETRDGSRSHEALDIMAPRGTPVHAVEDGTVAKLFTSKAGGLTIYQFDPSGTFSYYYAHLDRYLPGLAEGQHVRRGDIIGYVGSTGNASADAPHLHFGISRLTPERHWWQGTPLNPYDVLK